MSSSVLTDQPPEPALGKSRARVLELLRAAEEPVSVQDIAAETGLHPNTARFHLDGLVEAGLAERAAGDGGKPGRPRTVYRNVSTQAGSGRRSYRLLAEMLTSVVAGAVENPEPAAVNAGRQWGGYLVQRPAPTEQVDTADGIRRLSKLLTDTGFAPDPPTENDKGFVVGLRQCPFREIAEQHGEVVCSLHLGMMQGALAEARAPLTATTLDPLVEPSLCIAHLGTIDKPATAR